MRNKMGRPGLSPERKESVKPLMLKLLLSDERRLSEASKVLGITRQEFVRMNFKKLFLSVKDV